MAEKVERVSTGVKGLDEMLGGGYPKGRNILVIGMAGSGKTTLALQFIHDGAKKGEKGFYLSLEQKVEEIEKDAKTIGLDFAEFEKKKLVTFYDQSFAKAAAGSDASELFNLPEKFGFGSGKKIDFEKAYEKIIKEAKASGVSRFVVDSLPALAVKIVPGIPEENDTKMKMMLREMLINLCNQLKESGFTSLFISEAEREDEESDEFGIASYVTDGVVILKANPALDSRIMRVKKMRATSHSMKNYTFEFTGEGISMNVPKKTTL